MSLKGIFCTLFIILFTIYFSDASANLNNALVIDIGADTFKASILTLDRRPFFQVLLNTESKRKTPTVIAFHEGLPSIGDDAANLITRFPSKVHTNFFHFMGQSYELWKNSSSLKRGFRSVNVVENSARPDRIALYNDDLKSAMTPEELVAITLKEAKKQAEKVAKRAVVNLIITVPPFFTYEQRLILHDAASLAGLTVQAIVEDSIATALAYGNERFLNEEGDIKTVAFFDLGSSVTRASIVQFNKYHGTTTNVKAKLISSLWDFEVSGDQIDLLLAQHMLREAENGHSSARDLKSNPKAVEKIFREAKKLKETLSANKEATVVIENLTPEYDFRMTLTRSQFEEIVDSTFVTLDALVQELLKTSSLSPADINEIELVGGVSRVARIQKVIADRLEREVSYHINGDEGNLLGASYLASAISSKQEPMFDLQYPLLPLVASYPSGNTVELPWKYTLGSSIYLSLPVTSESALTLNLDFVKSNFKKTDPRVKNHFGTLNFKNVAEVRNARGLGSSMDAIVKLTFDVEGVEVIASLDYSSGSNHIQVLDNGDKLDTQNLLTVENSVSIKLLDVQEKSNSKSKIRTLEEKQMLQGQLAEAKSNLESSIFTAKEVLSTMEEYVNETDRAAISSLIVDAEKVLEANEDDQQGFISSLTALKDAINPVIFRSDEYRKQSIAGGAAKDFIKIVKNKFNDIVSKKKGESTEKEKQVLALIKEMEDWLAQKEAEQAEVPKTENPVYLAEDIYKRTRKLEGQYKEALGIKDKSTKKETEEFLTMQTKIILFVILVLGVGIGGPIAYRRYAEIDTELKGGRRLGTKKEKKEREKMKKYM